MLKYCDAFCGLGGFSLAVHSVLGENAQCVWAIDHDKNVSSTFFNNFGIKCHGDIREVDHQNIPDHDLLCGGFPCQPFSRNGKWFNHNDKIVGEQENRDNLFLELVKILNFKKPKLFLFENVKGLLSMKNVDGSLYFDTILTNLKCSGYRVFTNVIDAADYGVPQQRERIFFVGIRNDIKDNFVFPIKIPKTSCISDILENNVSEKYLLKILWENRKIKLGFKPENANKVNHPFPKNYSRYETIKYLYDKAIKPIKKTSKIESVAILYGDTPSGLPRQQDKIYSVYGISPTIATFSTPCIDSLQGLRQLTPRECARLQGIPENYILPIRDNLAYKQIGNAVTVPVISYILKELVKVLGAYEMS